jgi:hypothetical protein
VKNRNKILKPVTYRHFETEYKLSCSDVDEVITKLRQEGSSADVVTWLQGEHPGLTEEQCSAAIAHIRGILYGRRGGLNERRQPGFPVTVLFRMPVLWAAGDRTHWELLQMFPRLDLDVRTIETGENDALLEVDLSLPFPVGLWHTQRPLVARLTADAANLDTPAQVETVRARTAL